MDSFEWVKLGFAKALLVEVLGESISDRIEPHSMLVDDLGADSLDMVEMQCILTGKGVAAHDGAFTSHMMVCDLANLIKLEIAQ